jgi:hypothetical protein
MADRKRNTNEEEVNLQLQWFTSLNPKSVGRGLYDMLKNIQKFTASILPHSCNATSAREDLTFNTLM